VTKRHKKKLLGPKIGPEALHVHLKRDWWAIVTRAWSIRLMAIAAVLSGSEAVVGTLGPYLPISNTWLALLTFGIVASALVARLIAQVNLMSEDGC
jgi:intracellular septation protein A